MAVLIESHGDFTNSRDLTEILTGVDSDAFALLWDAHHTFVAGHEEPADTYAKLGRWVRHTHLKDSRPAGTPPSRKTGATSSRDWRGAGEKQVAALAKNGYKGYYCFEWEKKWHPEIEEPEVAFPQYAKTMAGYLHAAGVKPA